MKKIFKYIPLLAAGFLLMGCQDNDEADFANKAFINATSMRTETIIKGEAGIVNKTLNVAMPRPAESDIKVTARVDKSLVDTYNKAYYADAQLLPDSCYEVAEANMLINAGSVKSSDASFNFMKLSSLDRSLIYVLPVTVDTRDIELLSSAKNYYFVFKAGALINVVADIQDNYLEIYPWKTQDRISGMTQITMEALIYPREFGQLISTVMGIEGAFLMRIGDAGIPDNQIQIATSNGNFTHKNLQLTPGVWSHVAMTYSTQTREMIVYINGREMAKATMNTNISIGGNGYDRNFQIGRSYEDGRDLNGCISEARVWDVVRTQEQIASSIYTVNPASQGLLAYWKFDDQSTFVVKDHSGNGNDVKAMRKALVWKPVSLPASN